MERGNGSGRHMIPVQPTDAPRSPVPAEQYRHLMQWRWWLIVVIVTILAAGFGSALWLDNRFASRAQAKVYRGQHKEEHKDQREKINDMRDDLEDMRVINAKIAVSQENSDDRLRIIEAQQRQQLQPRQRRRIDDEIEVLRERIEKREAALRAAKREGKDPLEAIEGI